VEQRITDPDPYQNVTDPGPVLGWGAVIISIGCGSAGRAVNPNYGCGSDLDPTPTQTYGMSYLPEKYLFTRKIFTFTFNTYSKYKRRKIKP
jgi:hypothetical protein